jgi:uncharacterized protein YgiM (DUF1202 family)
MKKLFLFLFILTLFCCSFGQSQVTTADVNFRSSPEIKDNKICVIPKGTKILPLADTSKNWTKTSYNESVGYIRNDFLTTESAKTIISANENTATHFKAETHVPRTSTPQTIKKSSIPSGATAICNDGTYSYSVSHRGACSHHGGVSTWLK